MGFALPGRPFLRGAARSRPVRELKELLQPVRKLRRAATSQDWIGCSLVVAGAVVALGCALPSYRVEFSGLLGLLLERSACSAARTTRRAEQASTKGTSKGARRDPDKWSV